MDTRVYFVLGVLYATTSGFIPHLSRREDGAAKAVQEPDTVSVEKGGDYDQSMSCMIQSYECPPIRPMMDSLFSVHYGRKFIVNNHLNISCSAESKAKMDVCASVVRRSCTGHTNWIDGYEGFYEDLCTMEPVLLENAACMNSLTVSRSLQNCLHSSSRPICEIVIQCIWTAFDSDSSCSPQLKTEIMAAITDLRNTQFGANCERSL